MKAGTKRRAGSEGGSAEGLSALLSGTPYRAIAPLGRGGMGDVVLAEHVALGKAVVVKLLRAEMVGDPRLVERMLLEARALATLSHPHLVAVTDFGTTPEGRPYLVMDRLEGATLGEELRARGSIPIADAIRYVNELLDGLDAVHEAGLVHRDVKLGNVFLCKPDRQGRRIVKLLDFGIVKVPRRLGERMGRQYPTEEGAMLGTPRTAAPEQVLGRDVDARADLYAVGLLLYTLIAGRSPFHAVHDIQDLLRAQRDDRPPPLSTVAKEPVPAALDRALEKALAKDPDDRYATAVEMARALAAVEQRGEGAPAVPRTERTTLLLPVVSARSGADEPTRYAAKREPKAPRDSETETLTEPLPLRLLEGGRRRIAMLPTSPEPGPKPLSYAEILSASALLGLLFFLLASMLLRGGLP